jgi:formylglycine-generating enzyme required for sulfatase activity
VEGIELFEAIGEGRSATVWRARWRERDVAVKVLSEDWEVRAPRNLRHPSILSELARGRTLGRTYLVLERFPTDLSRLLGGRPLARGLVRPVLLQLLEAVAHAHQRGVVHGDLKPANVLVDSTASPVRVALTDFGQGSSQVLDLEASLRSAERDELEDGVSTLPYLAPERLAGGPATAAADVYALGVLLFEVLTGRLPIGLELPSELAPGVDSRFDALVKQLLCSRPAERLDVPALRRKLLLLLRGAPSEQGETEDAMVQIPGGFVVIGDRDDPQASPMHEVRLAPFWIDRHPVTHRDYQTYMRATRAPRPKGWPRGRLPRRLLEVPVSGVTWEQASAYAAWAGKRLPTEFEWERAAQGPEHRRFPYGETFDATRIHCERKRLAPVGGRPQGASSEGVHDLTGNGWEWTASPFVPYGGGGSPDERSRTIRGGYDPQRPGSGSATYRAGLRQDIADASLGFRCARDCENEG